MSLSSVYRNYPREEGWTRSRRKLNWSSAWAASLSLRAKPVTVVSVAEVVLLVVVMILMEEVVMVVVVVAC